MIWWLKAKNAPAVAAATLAVYGAAVWLRQEAIPVPALVGASGRLLITEILGVVPVALLVHGIDRGDAFIEEVARRRAGLRNAALCLGFAALTTVLGATAHLLWDRPEAVSLARNCLGFLGCALIVRTLLGPGIAMICVAALPLACAAAGRRPGGSAAPWAWPVHDATSLLGIAEAACLFAAGCTLALCRNRPLLNPLAQGTHGMR
ncbi:hypothetical protein ADL22_27385 [Streptomyces sp. NRRL F-4489]|uniref:hypothetical protein n=1 Tax=Streptomyces sp. NRRL F-4489 TaxID=1609095 RepID=UPI00074818D1|nr:hypothetical protein [Streptomyces sp. NRRL F-4489]KUL35424.1 hypothetical protein ADL22_27385 [Streptomyces sp. NRRL F-4489]